MSHIYFTQFHKNDPSGLIIRGYYMGIFISQVTSTPDAHISSRAEGTYVRNMEKKTILMA
jgi:hypothetical protein